MVFERRKIMLKFLFGVFTTLVGMFLSLCLLIAGFCGGYAFCELGEKKTSERKIYSVK